MIFHQQIFCDQDMYAMFDNIWNGKHNTLLKAQIILVEGTNIKSKGINKKSVPGT